MENLGRFACHDTTVLVKDVNESSDGNENGPGDFPDVGITEVMDTPSDEPLEGMDEEHFGLEFDAKMNEIKGADMPFA
jgi:hypothetical protein